MKWKRHRLTWFCLFSLLMICRLKCRYETMTKMICFCVHVYVCVCAFRLQCFVTVKYGQNSDCTAPLNNIFVAHGFWFVSRAFINQQMTFIWMRFGDVTKTKLPDKCLMATAKNDTVKQPRKNHHWPVCDKSIASLITGITCNMFNVNGFGIDLICRIIVLVIIDMRLYKCKSTV